MYEDCTNQKKVTCSGWENCKAPTLGHTVASRTHHFSVPSHAHSWASLCSAQPAQPYTAAPNVERAITEVTLRFDEPGEIHDSGLQELIFELGWKGEYKVTQQSLGSSGNSRPFAEPGRSTFYNLDQPVFQRTLGGLDLCGREEFEAAFAWLCR